MTREEMFENRDPYNIAHLAEVIQLSIREYYTNNPNDIRENGARKLAMDNVMRFGKGKYNPTIIESLINMERSCYPKPVCLQC